MNIDFKMGTNLTTTNSPIAPGQVLFNKSDSTLHIDTDNNERLHISNITNMQYLIDLLNYDKIFLQLGLKVKK